MATKITGNTLNKLGIPLAVGLFAAQVSLYHFAYDNLPKGIIAGCISAILTILWYTAEALLPQKKPGKKEP